MSNWPKFWNQQILGWLGYIRVDGTTYEWLGDGVPTVNFTTLLGLQMTPTRTIYSLRAGPSMLVNITFLSPIESDPVKQSLPFTYVYLDAISTDGLSHSVQVYADISAEWSSGNRSAIVTWKTTKTDTSTYHQVQLESPTPFTEVNDQAEDTTTYIAMRSGPSVSFTVAIDQDSRGGFARGALPPSLPATSAPMSNPFPVYAIAVDLGNITQTAQSVVWSIGVIRNPAVAYTTSTGSVVDRAPYFVVQYSDVESAIDAFVLDSDDARQRAVALDTQILGDSSNISSTYSNLVSIAARQTIGATELTVANGTDGKWNTSDVMMFMKDVGNGDPSQPSGNALCVFSVFPLPELDSSSQYTQPYAATDIGTSYPQATGNNRAHTQGIEQSGNMLIMSLAHARISGDGTYINRYYDLLKSWASYLANNTLTPNQQTTADLETQANMTNLAVKGIIGVQAMADISQALGKTDDATTFANAASSL
ncbi:hypothetical protein EUX98_g4981, partial [Antrodiella citrinella]